MPESSFRKIADQIFTSLAQAFPIACASDEFYYFPQIRISDLSWQVWDDFSPEAVQETVMQLGGWETQIASMNTLALGLNEQIELALLKKFVITLREQLAEIRFWQWQPSFYLMLANLGIAEAISSPDPGAKHERAVGLPSFLDRARKNLDDVPTLFREIALNMVSDTQQYFASLQSNVPELQRSQEALQRFADHLLTLPTRSDFALPSELLQRVVQYHLNSGLDLKEANEALDLEIAEMQRVMDEEARGLISNAQLDSDHTLWSLAIRSLPVPTLGTDGLLGLYRDAVNQLAQHCIDKKLISSELIVDCPVNVAPVPSYLAAIRTASSYSVTARHPAAGGTFYVNHAEVSGPENRERLLEYRMLAAHETYPGHHLLDTFRWNLQQPIRRHIEQPIYYEGWACFAEKLMRLTGFFSQPGDRFLLAKRRLWRATRGKVDLALQLGEMNFDTASQFLIETGTSTQWATDSVRKYPLNPGYQLCYAIGLRRFIDLFDRFGQSNLKSFVQTCLQQGEINFADLETILRQQQFDRPMENPLEFAMR
ncbi:MAG: DUF885 domain-containing protein [candidate division KSB1 bacterium]|nr:DUF885 domain-containing protein [candidate division KSB1 bacterium]